MNFHQERLLREVKEFTEQATRMLTRENIDYQQARGIANMLDQANNRANQLIGSLETPT